MPISQQALNEANRLRDDIHPLTLRVKQSLVALFRRPSINTVESVGCGVLLRIGDHRFILTAAHVTDEFKTNVAPWIAGEGVAIPALAVPLSTPLLDGQTRQDDPVDAAVIWLKPNCLDPSGRTYLSLDEIDVRKFSEERASLVIFGHPSDMTEQVPREKLAISGNLTLTTASLPRSAFRNSMHDSDKNVAMYMNRVGALRGDGVVGTIPKLEGLSGAGVWRYEPTDGDQLAQGARLVAIFTGFDQENKKLAFGTYIDEHLTIIASISGELHDAIEQHRMRFR